MDWLYWDDEIIYTPPHTHIFMCLTGSRETLFHLVARELNIPEVLHVENVCTSVLQQLRLQFGSPK